MPLMPCLAALICLSCLLRQCPLWPFWHLCYKRMKSSDPASWQELLMMVFEVLKKQDVLMKEGAGQSTIVV